MLEAVRDVRAIEERDPIMSKRWPILLAGSAVLGLLPALLRVGDSPAGQPGPDRSFAPVAPAAALQASLEFNFKVARDWLDQKDYKSAAQTAQCLAALAQLYGYQSDQPAWREQTEALRDACSKLADAARDKDKDACAQAAGQCEKLLAGLGKDPPAGAKRAVKDFKSFGSTKTWMLLMDGTYGDAKAARGAKQLENWAYALAEQANLSVHLKADPRWREAALQMREAALATAKKAQEDDLNAARGELKKVNQSCEACHKAFR